MKKFEQANADDPIDVIRVANKSLISAMRKVVQDLKNDDKSKGLTWDQIDYFLKKFGEKEPEVIILNGDEEIQ